MGLNRTSTIFHESYPSIKNIRAKVISSVIKTLSESGIPVCLTNNELYLIVDEALTNAMEHGNKWNPGKMVNITITKNSAHCIITIEDEGSGFDTITRKNGKHDPCDTLSLRGRGIKLIRQFCIPQWNAKGNRIDLCIPTRE